MWKNEATSLYVARDLQGLIRHLKIPTFFQMSPQLWKQTCQWEFVKALGENNRSQPDALLRHVWSPRDLLNLTCIELTNPLEITTKLLFVKLQKISYSCSQKSWVVHVKKIRESQAMGRRGRGLEKESIVYGTWKAPATQYMEFGGKQALLSFCTIQKIPMADWIFPKMS